MVDRPRRDLVEAVGQGYERESRCRGQALWVLEGVQIPQGSSSCLPRPEPLPYVGQLPHAATLQVDSHIVVVAGIERHGLYVGRVRNRVAGVVAGTRVREVEAVPRRIGVDQVERKATGASAADRARGGCEQGSVADRLNGLRGSIGQGKARCGRVDEGVLREQTRQLRELRHEEPEGPQHQSDAESQNRRCSPENEADPAARRLTPPASEDPTDREHRECDHRNEADHDRSAQHEEVRPRKGDAAGSDDLAVVHQGEP